MYEKYSLRLLAVVEIILILQLLLAVELITKVFLFVLAFYLIARTIKYVISTEQMRKQQSDFREKMRILKLNAEAHRVSKERIQNELEVTRSFLDATTLELQNWIDVAKSGVLTERGEFKNKTSTQAEIQEVVAESVAFRRLVINQLQKKDSPNEGG